MTFEDVLATRVRPLAEALCGQGLEFVRVGDADVEIELVRRRPMAAAALAHAIDPAAETDEQTDYDVLTSDVVGRVRFLRPAVMLGTVIDGDRDLGFIETLGIRNPIRSRGSGRVAVVYVEEGQAVDYGAPLFAIERSP